MKEFSTIGGRVLCEDPIFISELERLSLCRKTREERKRNQ